MNMFALLQKPRPHNLINAESPLAHYVKNNLFPADKYAREDLQNNSLLKFRDQTTGKSFLLEIKSCTCDWMHHIKWCTEMQLRKYLSCHKKTPTFLLLEVQNDNSNNNAYYLLSMTQASHVNLVDTSIMHCRIDSGAPISSKQLWSR